MSQDRNKNEIKRRSFIRLNQRECLAKDGAGESAVNCTKQTQRSKWWQDELAATSCAGRGAAWLHVAVKAVKGKGRRATWRSRVEIGIMETTKMLFRTGGTRTRRVRKYGRLIVDLNETRPNHEERRHYQKAGRPGPKWKGKQTHKKQASVGTLSVHGTAWPG